MRAPGPDCGSCGSFMYAGASEFVLVFFFPHGPSLLVSLLCFFVLRDEGGGGARLMYWGLWSWVC